MEDRVTAHGKQLMLDGEHLADCRDPEAAEVIAICLNRLMENKLLHTGESQRLREFFA